MYIYSPLIMEKDHGRADAAVHSSTLKCIQDLKTKLLQHTHVAGRGFYYARHIQYVQNKGHGMVLMEVDSPSAESTRIAATCIFISFFTFILFSTKHIHT